MAVQPEHRAAVVEFDHVTKRYDAPVKRKDGTTAPTPGAVNDLSLTVPAGKICVFVGPSGCGKTTSLKMVNRLIEPTSGQILIDGVDAATRDVTELRRSIGYVIQQVGLFPHQTIGENVATVPRLQGWTKERQRSARRRAAGPRRARPGKYRDRFPASCRAASGSASGWPGRWRWIRRSCSWTSPSGRSTRSSATGSRTSSCASRKSSPRPSCSSPTTSTRPSRWATSSRSSATAAWSSSSGPPAEILANPASEFVARFVGADRGLKRLALRRVSDLELIQPAIGQVGDDAADARRRAHEAPFGYLLLVDAANGPIGWIAEDAIPTSGALTRREANPVSPSVNKRTTLKDALSMMLDADVQAAIVVDRTGAVQGIMTVERVIQMMREGEHGETFGIQGDEAEVEADAARRWIRGGPPAGAAAERGGRLRRPMEGKPLIDFAWIYRPSRRRRRRARSSTCSSP